MCNSHYQVVNKMARKNKQHKAVELVEQINEDQVLDLMEEIQHEEQVFDMTSDAQLDVVVDDQPEEVVGEQPEEVVDEEQTELQQMLEEDKQFYINRKEELLKELAEINEKLKELGVEQQPSGNSKMDKMRVVYQTTTSRKEFIEQVVQSGLAGKPYASTAYQMFKKGK